MSEVFEENYIPGSMSFASGFLGPRGDVGYFMEFDLVLARTILKELLSDNYKIETAKCGLDGDWIENSDYLYTDGDYRVPEFYSVSQWAEPIMIVNFKDRPSRKYSVWYKKDKNK